MDAQNAQQIAQDELAGRDVRPSSAKTYQWYGNQLITDLRGRGLPISYEGLCDLARIRGVRLNTLEQRRAHLRYALAVSLLADADELAPTEVDTLADGLENLRARHGKDDPEKKAFIETRDLVEGGPKDASEKARAARKRANKRSAGDIARLAIGPAQEHAADRGYVDWRADLVDHVRDPADRELLRVQAVCGCRPRELLYGVEVTVCGDGALMFDIQGAKVQADKQDADGRFRAYGEKGQPSRGFVLEPIGDRLFDEVCAEIEEAGGQGVYKLKSEQENPVKEYGRRIKTVARQLKYEGVSAYSLRHQFGADLKAAGVEPERRAAVMGHRTTRSQQVYGQSQTGRRGLIRLAQELHHDRPIRDRLPTDELVERIRKDLKAKESDPDKDPGDGPGM